MWRVDKADIQWINDCRESRHGSPVVGDLVPSGYDCYVRIMHPAQRTYDERVDDISWHEVARINGRDLHALSRYADLVARGSATKPDLASPREGQLSDRLCERLVQILGSHTSSPSRCIFMFTSSWSSLLPFGEEFMSATLSDGTYAVVGGACEDACRFSISPTIWWPVDRSWVVVTDVDLDSSFVGCSDSTMQDLLTHSTVEAWQVLLLDPVPIPWS